MNDLPGNFLFLCKDSGQIQIVIGGYDHTIQDQIVQHGVDFLFGNVMLFQRNLLIEHLISLLNKILPFKIQMPVRPPGIIQSADDRTLDPHGVMEVTVGFQNNGIYPPETEARNLAQFKRTSFQNLNTCGAKVLVNLQSCLWGQLEGFQQRDDVLQHPGLGIGAFDLIQFGLGNSPDLQITLWGLFQNFQCIHSELCNDLGCCGRTYAFDQPGAQIGTKSLHGRRHDFMPLVYLKLNPILTLHPLALHLDFNRIGKRKVMSYRCKPNLPVPVLVFGLRFSGDAGIFRSYLDDAVPVGWIYIDFPVKGTPV